MAIRIDIDKKQLEHLLDVGVASSRRAITQSRRPEFEELYKKDIEGLIKAKASISEIK